MTAKKTDEVACVMRHGLSYKDASIKPRDIVVGPKNKIDRLIENRMALPYKGKIPETAIALPPSEYAARQPSPAEKEAAQKKLAKRKAKAKKVAEK